MLLRASSTALRDEVDTRVAVGEAGDPGVAHGALLERFASAAHTGGPELAAAEAGMRGALGDDAWVEAAMTVAIFNGLVRTADASGIPLDDGVVSATADDRELLGLDNFGGSGNSDLTIAAGATPGPALFG